MIRIALVDDHSLFRRGLKMLLTSHADFEVVAEASSGEEFLGLLDTARPDVVFMDYSMGGISGAETTERALERMPELKVISLTMFGDNAYYSRMATSGAKGFLLKDSEFDEVVEAVRTVCDGGTYFSALLLESLSQSLHSVEGSVRASTSAICCRSARWRFWWVFVRDSLRRRLPTDTLYRNARWISTAPIFSKKAVVKIRPALWFMP